MKVATITLLSFLTFFTTSWSQTRYESWIRVNLNHVLSNRLSTGLELQHRRQSNYWNHEKNILDESMQTMIRPWIYWKDSKKFTYLISPLSFHQYREIINKKGDTRDYLELRSTYGLQKNFTLNETSLKNRVLFELRLTDIKSNQLFFQTRLRIQQAFLLPIFKIKKQITFFYNCTNELFIVQRHQLIYFDQNRFFNGLQAKKGNIEINIGYQWSQHNGNPLPYSRRQVLFNTNIDL